MEAPILWRPGANGLYGSNRRVDTAQCCDVTVQLFPILIPYNNLGKENLKSNIIHNNLFYNRIKSFTFINTCSDHPYTYTYTTDSSWRKISCHGPNVIPVSSTRCRLLNCEFYSSFKNRKDDWLNKKKKTNGIYIEIYSCLKVYTKVQWFSPVLMGPPYLGLRLFMPQQNLFLYHLGA